MENSLYKKGIVNYFYNVVSKEIEDTCLMCKTLFLYYRESYRIQEENEIQREQLKKKMKNCFSYPE